MQYRKLGNLETPVSAIGFGCWAVGGAAWGLANDADAVGAVHRALDYGITLFDTAPGYGAGHSERLLATALKGKRDSAVLATKFGFPVAADGTVGMSNKPSSIAAEVDDSLRRLGTDYIDIYLMHWPDTETPIGDVVDTLATLKAKGKIRAVGLCNVDANLLNEACAAGSIDAIQVPYNLFMRGIEKDVLRLARERGIGVMGYGSLAFGLLGGTMTLATAFSKTDWRSGQVFGSANWAEEEGLFAPGAFEGNLAKVDALRAIAAGAGMTVAELAVRWCLRDAGVTTSLVGGKRPGQVDAWAQASDKGWPEGIEGQIEAAMGGR